MGRFTREMVINLAQDAAKNSQDIQSDHDSETLARAENIREEEDGTITFTVERHPSIFGRSTLGHPSSAFLRIQKRWRLDPRMPKLSLVGKKTAGIEFNYDAEAMLRVQDLEITSVIRNDELLEMRSKEEVERAAAGISWINEDEFSDEVPELDRKSIAQEINKLCEQLWTKKVVGYWCNLTIER